MAGVIRVQGLRTLVLVAGLALFLGAAACGSDGAEPAPGQGTGPIGSSPASPSGTSQQPHPAPTGTTAPPPTARPTSPASPGPASPTGPAAGTGTPEAVSPVEEATLAPGQSARFAGGAFTVRFVAVPEDSRCPVSDQVACVWAGDAVVSVSVSGPGLPETSLELHTDRQRGPAATVAGHEIRLVRLEPERTTTGPVDPGAYRATVRVSRL
ncbi:hypothetical protein I6A84_44620 [Frankia sp. CNm7]|uniref:Lipoprotein n=1 Tax=Frankia nepalensis TaxID=1836974 RepID=A0A937RHP6_9ACTN|nr:hypothetical protein [Frankia nepalensis]MBL7495202.1 hypothetical protein [Frankia nepalensis]MBL7515721.1 hypothetical protein [Frankia nepalensis]MBL7524933.1 hypothetical protein [Frankia nepalensis]MBL7632433.1 hypothetical protein [Frankia nepalensis]